MASSLVGAEVSPTPVNPEAPPAAEARVPHSTRVYIGMKLNKWLIITRIGAGSFGETFAAIDAAEWPNQPALEEDATKEEVDAWLQLLPPVEDRKEVCVKVEQENKNVLSLEALALKRVQTCAQVVRYLGSGCTGGMHFLVMEKLGPNLADLRRRSTHGTFNIYTTLKAGISCLQAIREVHERGLIHRDIKPSNFITGLPGTSENATCYLIDFGLARRFRRSSGELREAREHAGFRGTSRYASVASHRHTELGRVDDLWSLLFMLVEFATGTLPWRKFKVKEDIGLCKEKSIGPKLVRNLPREFQLFLTHLQSLRYEDEPNYDLLLSCFHRAVERRGYPPDKPLDWQLEEEEVVQEESPPIVESPPKVVVTPVPIVVSAPEPQPVEVPPLVVQAPSEPPQPEDLPLAGTVRASEVDISCAQTARNDTNNADEEEKVEEDPQGPEGDVVSPADDNFSPREAKAHRPGGRRHRSPSIPNEVADAGGEDDDGLLSPHAAADDNGTTSINVPPIEPRKEKTKSKCDCVVM